MQWRIPVFGAERMLKARTGSSPHIRYIGQPMQAKELLIRWKFFSLCAVYMYFRTFRSVEGIANC